MMVGVSIGVGTIFGAPTVVGALTGKTIFECDQALYNTVCDGGGCYSCPVGYSGVGCTQCATGYSGANCNTCDVGYTGVNCNICDVGYHKYNNRCSLDCDVVGRAGVADTTVHSGIGSLPCVTGNYGGNLSYVCDDSNFTVTTPCGCIGKYDVASGCSSCVDGYSLSSGCTDCDADYTKVGGVCYEDCHVTGVSGIQDNTLALPLNGTLGCVLPNGNGSGTSINYTCTDGNFSTTQSCFTHTQCYESGTYGTLLMIAPSGKVWRTVIYAMYGAVSGCQDDSTALCGFPQRTVSVVDTIASQCLNRNSCSVYVNTFLASSLGVNVCDMSGANASINKLNVMLGY